MDELARLLSSEHGKTVADAKGDIQRGLEVVEFAVGAPHLLKGEYTESAGTGIDVYSMRQPLGVVAGITPFNFPAMIPLWKAAPGARRRQRLHPQAVRARPLGAAAPRRAVPRGRPARRRVQRRQRRQGSGRRAAHRRPRVKAVGFVGSTPIAQYIYETAAAHGKRAQCFGGAKNHAIVMPDADLDQVADALIGAGYGSAGERCMAISVAVPVGEETADALVAKLTRARRRSCRIGTQLDDEGVDYGPLVTRRRPRPRQRLHRRSASTRAPNCVVDGRGFALEGHENGFFAGATLFDHVTTGHARSTRRRSSDRSCRSCAPRDYEEALRLPTEHEYGNGVAIFTRDGDTARDFTARVDVGMVGVNVPIPVPIAYHTFGGWKASGFGDLNQHGPDSFRFYTKTKTVTQRWPSGVKEGDIEGAHVADTDHFVIPTMD